MFCTDWHLLFSIEMERDKSPSVTLFLLFLEISQLIGYLDNFKSIMDHTESIKKVPYNFESSYLCSYFGKEKQKTVNFQELSQLLYDFRREQATQAFRACDKSGKGYISIAEFREIITNMRSDILTPFVIDNLSNV